ncbi:MAG: hypothetical protein VYB54_07700 [Pseudomonadota bacterium]|nr:hypothetical protein [Pseudomonadota bacterium]
MQRFPTSGSEPARPATLLPGDPDFPAPNAIILPVLHPERTFLLECLKDLKAERHGIMMKLAGMALDITPVRLGERRVDFFRCSALHLMRCYAPLVRDLEDSCSVPGPDREEPTRWRPIMDAAFNEVAVARTAAAT